MRTAFTKQTLLLVAVFALVAMLVSPAAAVTRIKDISRLKGQEENTLQGWGLVVGLNGTGDGGNFLPTIRPLAQMLQLMGNQLGDAGPLELKNANNVALVLVTATVPAAGGRQGDQIDCQVMSIGAAKSLAGGRLFMTPLTGPIAGSRLLQQLHQRQQDHPGARAEPRQLPTGLGSGRVDQHATADSQQQRLHGTGTRPGEYRSDDPRRLSG